MSLTDENNFEFGNVSQNNYNRVYNTVSKVGYSDGITDGRDSVFQKGFDSGYENGLLIGFELAKYKAFFVVTNQNSAPDDIRNESTIYADLHVSDKVHFKSIELPASTTTEISNHQTEYVNQQKGVFAKELPIVTNLFSQ